MMHHTHAIKRNRGFPPFGVAIACRHNLPRCRLPSRQAACGYGPRLWQIPAAALRPAGRPKRTENTLHPICHSSFVIFASVRSVSLWQKSAFHLCCEADVRLCGSKTVQPSPTQSNHTPVRCFRHLPARHASFIIRHSKPSFVILLITPVRVNPGKSDQKTGRKLFYEVATACRHNIPRCPLPPQTAARIYGPRLWQSPAAALRPAGRSKPNESSRPPIRHSSLISPIQ